MVAVESIHEIVLVRHAQPEWVKDGLNVDDPPLTEAGREQARHMASVLAGETFDEIIVSPLRRARETAEPLLGMLGREEVIHPWLEEIRSPIWHGTPVERAAKAWEEMKSRPPSEQWAGLDGGEPVSDFVERVNLGCAGFLAERGITRVDTDLPVWQVGSKFVEGSRICIVAHAGTNSVAMCHFLGLAPTPWEWERFILGHASVSRVHLFALGDGATFSMARLSDVEHLPADLRTF